MGFQGGWGTEPLPPTAFASFRGVKSWKLFGKEGVVMVKPRMGQAVWAVLGVTLMSLVASASAEVVIRGNVRVWNPITGSYEPLKQARVRVVLGEYHDYDTLDVEGRTDLNGNYSLTKGNAWFRDGYDAYLIVFAEVPNKLEVQSHYLQIDGYQAVSGTVFARNGRTTTIDLLIGGSQDNVHHYQVGGVNGDAADRIDRTRGQRAFIICHEMTDHRLRLVEKALDEGDFEEKEVSYPVEQDVANYTGILDYIRFPDGHFGEGPRRVSEVCRHELSHGVMADAYWLYPAWTHIWDIMGSHSLHIPREHRDVAWVEAWAEFLAEVTQRERYGEGYNDLESLDADWHSKIPSGADHSFVEGEIASALWDIFDGVGWEKRYEQVPEVPGDEKFYDGIADPDLSKIWHIFKTFRPYGFTHVEYMGKPDNFVWYWLNRTGFGQRHELKAILFNRGIRVPELPQHPPSVTVVETTWRGDDTALVKVRVRELDPEDRPHVWVEVYLNGRLWETARMAGGWKGDETEFTFVLHGIEWREGQPYPTMIVHAHDNMQSGYVRQTLTPSPRPKPRAIREWVVELLSVSVRNFDPRHRTLRDVVLNITASGGQVSRQSRLPSKGSWEITPDSEFQYTQTTELLRAKPVEMGHARQFQVRFSLNSSRGTWTLDRTYPLGGTRPEVWDVTLGVEVEMTIRIRSVAEGEEKELAEIIATRPRPTFLPPVWSPSRNLPSAPPTKKPLSPTALLARASQLSDEYARLQAKAAEIADELEWKLSAERLPKFWQQGPQGIPIRPDMPSVSGGLKRRLLSGGPVKLPPTPFLDEAVHGKGLAARLPAQASDELAKLKAEISDIEQRLQGLRSEIDALRTEIDRAVGEVKALKPPTAEVDKFMVQGLGQALERLKAFSATFGDLEALLSKERQVVERGSTLVK